MSSIADVTWIPADRAELVIITERVASAVSTLGCLFVFITFALSKRLRRPVNRLLFYSTIANLCMDVASFIAFSGMYAGKNSTLCQIQGFFVQMFLPTDVLWNLAMAINTYLTVFKHYDARRLRKLEWFYNLFNFGLPFIIALIYCFITTPSQGKVYGPAILWCWVSDQWDVFRIALCYGPVWIGIAACTLIYIAAGVSIFRRRNQLRVFRRRAKRATATSSMAMEACPNAINQTTEVRTISTIRHRDSEEKITTSGQYQCSAEALPQNPFGGVEMQYSSQNSALQANVAAWAYAKAAILFFVCLLITWVPSSVFRVFSVIYPDVHNFPLAYAAAIVLPLQGFWNAIIYVIVSWDAFRMWITVDLKKSGSSTDRSWPFAKMASSPRHTIDGKASIISDNRNSDIDASVSSVDGRPDVIESMYGLTGTGTPKLPSIHRSRSSLQLNDRVSQDPSRHEQRFSRTTSMRSAGNIAKSANSVDRKFSRSASAQSMRIPLSSFEHHQSHPGRAGSVRSMRYTNNSFDPAGSMRPPLYSNGEVPANSTVLGSPPSMDERPGTAPESFGVFIEGCTPRRISGLVELPTAITPRAPSSPVTPR